MKEEPTQIEQSIQCEAGPTQCECRMTQPVKKSIGQIGYEAYCEKSNGKSLVSGCELPSWGLLKDDIKEAWEAAALSVKMAVQSYES